MVYPCIFGKNPTTGSQDITQTRKLLKIGSLSATVILKIRSWSPKPNQFFLPCLNDVSMQIW